MKVMDGRLGQTMHLCLLPIRAIALQPRPPTVRPLDPVAILDLKPPSTLVQLVAGALSWQEFSSELLELGPSLLL